MKAVVSSIFLFLVLYLPARADGGQEDTAKKDDYIVVVPFKPQMYTVTGDYFICKSNDMTPGELSELIRRSLTTTLVNNLSYHYNSAELPGSTQSADSYSDLATAYKILRVRYHKKKKLLAYYKGYPPHKIKDMLSPRYKRWGSDCVNNYSEKPNETKHKYAEAVITNDSAFKDLCVRNKASYMLVITQFEMYTRFKTCLDLQQNIFQRDFFVHFTIFDKDGKEVEGGVVATTWQSDTNDVKTIAEENLGTLTGFMVDMCRKNF